ncbi:MAG TPA: HAD family hydrolase [Thermoanaerobaculia bacterium]|nr:HAD family hydrolase [Thermoanaerobaculia bacterium]
MRETKNYRGILLDMDGTLIDSNDAHARAWYRAFADNGEPVAYDEIRQRIGMGGDNLLPAILGIEKESELGSRISERRSEIYRDEYLPGIRPFPGVRPLLERMRETGLRLAIATSSPTEELEPAIDLAGIRDLLEKSTSADDADSSKPDPDILHAALDQLGLRPEDAVMLGDTPYDIAAAGRAGLDVIAFRSGGFSDEDLTGAVALFDGPEDLLKRWEESPLAAAQAVAAGDRT